MLRSVVGGDFPSGEVAHGGSVHTIDSAAHGGFYRSVEQDMAWREG